MIKINQKIDDFEMEIYHEEKIKKIRLSNYKGRWLILFFYPADFTFVCPTELSELADLYNEFKKEKAEIISVSCDTVFAHKAWFDISPSIKKIKFPMAADPNGKIAKYFNVYDDETGMSYRASFLIDPDKNLKAFEITNNDLGRSGKELLRKLKAARFISEHQKENLVCPASWEPGKNALNLDLKLAGKL